jgi:hypothetical protein
MEARQELQVSGFNPYLARSWLMSTCCVDPMTIAAVTTGRETVAGAFLTGGLAAFAGGWGLALGVGWTLDTSATGVADDATAW